MARNDLAVFLAWLFPGAGHFALGLKQRALAFCVLVLAMVVIGCQLDGRLWWVWQGSPLQILATLGSMGLGLPFFALHYFFDYQGNLGAAGYEYGSAFLLTSGLMNLLLVLDTWDISHGVKS